MPRANTACRSSRVGTLFLALTSRNLPARKSRGLGNKKAAATYFHEVLETLEDVPESRYVELARKALDNIAQENN